MSQNQGDRGRMENDNNSSKIQYFDVQETNFILVYIKSTSFYLFDLEVLRILYI